MRSLDRLIEIALEELRDSLDSENKDDALSVFANYMPTDIEGLYPIGDEDDSPEGMSCLYVNLSHDDVDMHVHITDLSGRSIPVADEPMVMSVFISGRCVIQAKEKIKLNS